MERKVRGAAGASIFAVSLLVATAGFVPAAAAAGITYTDQGVIVDVEATDNVANIQDHKPDTSTTFPYSKTFSVAAGGASGSLEYNTDIRTTATSLILTSSGSGSGSGVATEESGGGKFFTASGSSQFSLTVASDTPYELSGTGTFGSTASGPDLQGVTNSSVADALVLVYKTATAEVFINERGESNSNDHGLSGGTVPFTFDQNGTLPAGTYRVVVGSRCEASTNQPVGTTTCSEEHDIELRFGTSTGITVSDVTDEEGNDGLQPFVFHVTLPEAAENTVTVHYTTTGISATEGGDFASASGTLTFAPGDLSEDVTVGVLGDGDREDDETFHLDLDNPSGATIDDGIGVGTIVNDDLCQNTPTAGPDVINGTPGDDILCGGDGRDIIKGLGGADQIYGEAGSDDLDGGAGDDLILGGGGGDDIDGGVGEDGISGGSGDDLILGARGDDVIGDVQATETGADTIFGAGGSDIIRAGPGKDPVEGGRGEDIIFGGDDRDKLHGNDDADEIHGGDGDDDLWGEEGDDKLYGDSGSDTIVADVGDDTLYGGADDDFLRGGEGADALDGGGGPDTLLGGDDDDIIDGHGGVDIIHGGDGPDIIRAGGGDETDVDGEGGGDVIFGQGGKDLLAGGGGDDEIDGGAERDRMFGNGGADTFKACDNVLDELYGGGGSDIAFRDLNIDDLAAIETKHNC